MTQLNERTSSYRSSLNFSSLLASDRLYGFSASKASPIDASCRVMSLTKAMKVFRTSMAIARLSSNSVFSRAWYHWVYTTDWTINIGARTVRISSSRSLLMRRGSN